MYSNNIRIKTQLGNTPSTLGSSPNIVPSRNNRSRSPLRGPRDVNSPSSQFHRTASTASSSLSVVSKATNNSTTSLQLSHEPTAHTPGSPPRSPSPPISADNDTVRNRPERVYALHDYAPSPENSSCLSFREGQVILVHNTDPSGWWDGEIDGRRGWFPSNYVRTDTYFPTQSQSVSAR